MTGRHDPDAEDLDLSGAELSGVVAALRSLDPADAELISPPPSVWDGIVRGLAADTATVVPLARRPWAAGRRVLAIAAAIVLLGGLATALRPRTSGGVVVASASLAWDRASFDPLGETAVARAQLLKRGGHYELRLTDAKLPDRIAGSPDLELWMISLDASGAPADIAPISLVDADRPGTYRVPASVDPATHVVVDISVEPRDGDAKHSGRSILRGPLVPT